MNLDPALDFSHLGLTLLCYVAMETQGMEPLYFYVDEDMGLYYFNRWHYERLHVKYPPELACPYGLGDYFEDGDYTWEPKQYEIAKKYSVMMELMK